MTPAQQKSALGLTSNGSNGQTKQDLAEQHHQLRKQDQVVQVSCHLHPPYGSETWTLLAESKKRVQDFETSCIRRLFGIFYSEHMTIDWVRSKINFNSLWAHRGLFWRLS